MPKSYSVSKKQDMDKFQKDLLNTFNSKVEQKLNQSAYEIKCPYCQNKISVKVGKSPCPICFKTVDLSINITS